MNYKSIYQSLCARGKKRRVKRAGWGAWHRHHIVPRHAGGDNSAHNLTRLQVKEHRLAHLLLHRIHGRQGDKVAAWMLSGTQQNPWENKDYRDWMLPKVRGNLAKADRTLAGQRAGEVVRELLARGEGMHSPEARAKSIAARRAWVAANREQAQAVAAVMHTPEAVDRMSRSKTKRRPVGPDGTVYDSIKHAAEVTGLPRHSIDNWTRRGHYGWSQTT